MSAPGRNLLLVSFRSDLVMFDFVLVSVDLVCPHLFRIRVRVRVRVKVRLGLVSLPVFLTFVSQTL